MNRTRERGNVLWFILIAIVLLGILTMILSRTGSSVNQTGSQERLQLEAFQIMRYARSIEAAVQNLMLHKCSENEISFENTVTTIDYTNARAPTDESCHIFAEAGAGLRVATFSDNTFTSGQNDEIVFHSSFRVLGVETDATRSGNDLIIGIAVDQELCTQINKEMGINPASDSEITSDLTTWDQPYTGTFRSVTFVVGDTGTPVAEALYQETTGCLIDQDGEYGFYHVLMAR